MAYYRRSGYRPYRSGYRRGYSRRSRRTVYRRYR